MQKQLSLLTGIGLFGLSGCRHCYWSCVWFKLKQQMVADIESNYQNRPFLQPIPLRFHWSNCSKSSTPRNDGLHYFSLSTKCRWRYCSRQNLARDDFDYSWICRRQEKPRLWCDECFYVNRILAPYERSSKCVVGWADWTYRQSIGVVWLRLVNEIVDEWHWCWYQISPILEAELGDRFKAPDAFSKLLDNDRKGKKNVRASTITLARNPINGWVGL